MASATNPNPSPPASDEDAWWLMELRRSPSFALIVSILAISPLLLVVLLVTTRRHPIIGD